MVLTIFGDGKLSLKKLISTFISNTKLIVFIFLFLISYHWISRMSITFLYLFLYKARVVRVTLIVKIVTIKLLR